MRNYQSRHRVKYQYWKPPKKNNYKGYIASSATTEALYK